MTISDAEPGDIYIDASGKLWRITAVYREPTVEAQEVEGTLHDPGAPQISPQVWQQGQIAHQGLLGGAGSFPPPRASIVKKTQRGFMGADIWNGWKRIWRGYVLKVGA